MDDLVDIVDQSTPAREFGGGVKKIEIIKLIKNIKLLNK
jgi:hypothetical protein